ncbi:MAG: GGDEF-domain containing protein, partial [Alphaproteobacteria bacterium]
MGNLLGHVLKLFKVPEDNPALTISQFEAFSKQVPLLYFILLANMASLVWTHAGVTPAWLGIYAPGVLAAICVTRMLRWFINRNVKVDAEQAYRSL